LSGKGQKKGMKLMGLDGQASGIRHREGSPQKLRKKKINVGEKNGKRFIWDKSEAR